MKASELRIFTLYHVSAEGVVTRLKTGRVIKQRINEKGYPCVSLSIDGKQKYISVHRLVAMRFIPNPDNKPCVNHINRNRKDPHVSNLEWVTHQENVRHSVVNGGRKTYKRNNTGKNNPNSRLTPGHIEAIIDLNNIGYSQNRLAALFSVTQSTICKIVNKQLWKQAS